jgi:NAD-dependent SIR2 family protein deacetylase
MSPDSSSLGHCPDCGRSIPPGWKLIEYEQEDGSMGVFAECPSCEEVIKPE